MFSYSCSLCSTTLYPYNQHPRTPNPCSLYPQPCIPAQCCPIILLSTLPDLYPCICSSVHSQSTSPALNSCSPLPQPCTPVSPAPQLCTPYLNAQYPCRPHPQPSPTTHVPSHISVHSASLRPYSMHPYPCNPASQPPPNIAPIPSPTSLHPTALYSSNPHSHTCTPATCVPRPISVHPTTLYPITQLLVCPQPKSLTHIPNPISEHTSFLYVCSSHPQPHIPTSQSLYLCIPIPIILHPPALDPYTPSTITPPLQHHTLTTPSILAPSAQYLYNPPDQFPSPALLHPPASYPYIPIPAPLRILSPYPYILHPHTPTSPNPTPSQQ